MMLHAVKRISSLCIVAASSSIVFCKEKENTDRYHIKERIGHGGYSTVARALDTHTGKVSIHLHYICIKAKPHVVTFHDEKKRMTLHLHFLFLQ